MRSQLEIHTIIAGIFSVTVALSWNEVAKSAISAYCTSSREAPVVCTIAYASLSTVLIIIVAAVLYLINEKKNRNRI